MRRSKKSLGSAILVSVLSAAMTFSMPAYALTVTTDTTIDHDVTDGLQVSEGATVTVNGTVSDEKADKEKWEDAVAVFNSSKVTINDDVNTHVENMEGTVAINGNVNTDVDMNRKTEGVQNYDGTMTIEKNVTVDTKTAGTAVDVYAHSRKGDKTTGEANISIGGDISIKSSGSTGVDRDTGFDENGNKYPDTYYFYDPTGLSVYTSGNAKVNADIAGKIESSSKGVATGITVGTTKGRDNIESDSATETKEISDAKINITSGSVSALGTKEFDKSQEGELDNSESNGIYISNGGDVNSEVNITVDGDLTSEIGIAITNRNDKTTKAVNNIVVAGTIKPADDCGAVYIFNRKENDNTFSLTTWKIDSNATDNVVVKKIVESEKDGKVTQKRVVDEEASDKLSDNINYIIRHEGTITLDGVTTIHANNGKSYETAQANKQLTIHVNVEDEKKYRVDRVEGGTATAIKNPDGSWTLTVPKNGGVDIRAVLVAIEQKENQSSSGSSSGGSSSGGGSSSSRPGVNNASAGMMTTTPEGATVQTNVMKNDTSSVTTASVRIGTSTANVSSSISDQNGMKVTVQNADGNLAGASFKGVGQISADGTTLVKEDGTTAKMATGMLLAIENADGTSVGCFVDATGKTIATGAFEVYYMLGTDGKLHAHFVNPQGYFMTGIQVINGQTVTFNTVGEMVSVI